MKSVRRGEWTLQQIETYFADKEKFLEALYASSTLQHSPDEEAIKAVLLECLEMHYGSLSAAIVRNPSMEAMLNDMKELVARYDRPV